MISHHPTPLASRRTLQTALLAALLLTAVACGNTTGGTGEQTIDFDALDVDFDTLDVDISGIDIASFQDVNKQDTIGFEVNPPDVQLDVQPDIQPDVQPDIQPDVPPPECTMATTCADDSACTTDTCENGKCVHTNNTAACEDGSACTLNDACKDGACLPGTATACNDENPCTDDSCNPATGCVNAPNSATCTDGSVCTLGDACQGGACLPGDVSVCDDGNFCTTDSCDGIEGCNYAANALECDDGDICTIGDQCGEGSCAGSPNPCDDGNVCTNDFCNSEGCGHNVPEAFIVCDDQNICTSEDYCNGATCTGYTIECPGSENQCLMGTCDLSIGCTLTAATWECNDGDPCTQIDTCKDAVCLGSDVTACTDWDACNIDTCVTGLGCDNTGTANCDDGNTCTTDSCDSATGCVHTNLPGETLCDDGDACTESEVCASGGLCSFGVAVYCNDENGCTSDSCDSKTGCVFLPLDVTCDDGNPCTDGDFCDIGYCVSGFPTNCDDGNPCSSDVCQPLNNGKGTFMPGCQHFGTGGTCEDGNPCTGGDWCNGTECMPGEGQGCDDANACTNDFCSTVAPGCGHTINPDATVCDDGNACTQGDLCNTATGLCESATPVTCSPDGPCQSDVCDPLYGCQYLPKCDDGNPCTTDVCDVGACSHTPLAVFQDSFAKGNINGWTLGTEWQIGTAKQGPVGDLAPGDPPFGLSEGENEIAGVDIGGNAKRIVHDYYYLTSPVIDTSTLANPALEFWSWLETDSSPAMDNVVEVWDGTAWQTLSSTVGYSWTQADSYWIRQSYKLGQYSNAQLQFRIGFKIGDAGVLSAGSWSIDAVTIGEIGACVMYGEAKVPPLPQAGALPKKP